jgi:hypothetical protein
MLRPCRRGSDISFLRGTALNNPTDHYVDPREYIISILKRRRSQARIPIPRAPSPPASAGGYDTTGNRAVTTKNRALAASIMMLATISGQALAGTAAPKAQYWRSNRPLRPSGGTRFQCYRSADGDTDDGAQYAPLSWRTEIQRLIPHDLERFGTITLVGLPSSAAKNRPQLGRGSWRRSLKVPVGGPARF